MNVEPWVADLNAARPLVAAGLLIRDDAGAVLLVKPSYKEGWDIPGGMVEPAETPSAAAAREVVEELGRPLPVGALLVVDWAPQPGHGDKLLFVFDGGVLPCPVSELSLQASELVEARFVPVADIPAHVPPRLARRLALAVAALVTGVPSYAEFGLPRLA